MKHIFILVIATILYTSSIAQTIGSKVSIVAVDGKTYTGIIKEIQGNKYKVKYDGYDFDSWLTGNQFTVVNANVPTTGTRQNNAENNNAVTARKVTVDANNTLSADRPVLQCPVQQSPVKNGAQPNIELFKKIIRCNKGEKAASKGLDGAVTIEVTAMQLGTPRKWQYARDIGGGPNVIIHPVKTTFTYKTFYRSGTDVSENWIRIINFHVNEFGEWVTGSEEAVKSGETKNIPRG